MGVVLLEVAGSSLFEESSGKGRKAVVDQGGQKMVGQESSPKSITSMERKSKSVVVDLKIEPAMPPGFHCINNYARMCLLLALPPIMTSALSATCASGPVFMQS